jgi:hypothetical protein
MRDRSHWHDFVRHGQYQRRKPRLFDRSDFRRDQLGGGQSLPVGSGNAGASLARTYCDRFVSLDTPCEHYTYWRALFEHV